MWAAAALGEIEFQPEVVGAYWRQHRGKDAQLDVVAANRREKQLLVGEAKWGKGIVSRRLALSEVEGVLTDLVERSRRMPQVVEGWSVQYLLFAREGFSEATQAAANEIGARLVSLSEMEHTLVSASV